MTNQLVETVKELKLLGWSEEGAKGYAELLEKSNFSIFSSNQYLLLVTLLIFSIFILIYISTRTYLERDNRNNASKEYLSGNKSISTNIKTTTLVPKDRIVEAREHHKNLNQPISIKNNSKIAPIEPSINLINYSNLLNKVSSIDLEKVADNIITVGNIAYKLIELSFQESERNKVKKSISQASPSDVYIKRKLSEMNSIQLRSLLKEENIPLNTKKKKLIDVILSNPSLKKKFLSKERTSALMQKTNAELKSMLNGVDNISRLKKVELVKKIIAIESEL